MADTTTTQIAQLQAQLRTALGQIAALQNAPVTTPTVSVPQMTFITPVLVASGTAQVSWTTFTSSSLPSSATAVILDGHFQNDSGSNNESKFYIRANPQDANARFLLYCFSGGPLGEDQSTGPGFGIFPCSNGSFQWSTSNALMSYTARLIGYISPSTVNS